MKHYLIYISNQLGFKTYRDSSGLYQYNLMMLLFMISAGIIGGFVGSYLNRRLSKKAIEHLFNIVMSLILLLNTYNVFVCFLCRGWEI